MLIGALSMWLMATAVAACAACSTTQVSQAGSTTAAAQQAEPWRLTLRFSGGLAGFDRELTLASTGELAATDRKRSLKVTTPATASEMSHIASLVAKAAAATPARETGCRDCLLYDIDLQRGARSFVAHFDDVTLAGSQLEELVRALTTLLNRVLAA